jgi:hypothetical protein
VILCTRERTSPSVPMDREDGRQRVPAQLDLPISGFPLPVSCRQAVPEPEMIIGLSSQATTSIRKQGGTHSPVLCRMTWELLQFCRRENIVLVPRYIPGKHNILVDALCRSYKLVSTEWTLHMDIVQAV